jgi:hypothetical protein
MWRRASTHLAAGTGAAAVLGLALVLAGCDDLGRNAGEAAASETPSISGAGPGGSLAGDGRVRSRAEASSSAERPGWWPVVVPAPEGAATYRIIAPDPGLPARVDDAFNVVFTELRWPRTAYAIWKIDFEADGFTEKVGEITTDGVYRGTFTGHGWDVTYVFRPEPAVSGAVVTFNATPAG